MNTSKPALACASMPAVPTLGWKEEVALPDWGIRRLRVKLDTGARTSAIHAREVREVGQHWRAGQQLPVVQLVLALSRRNPERVAEITAPVVGYKRVRDTGARAEQRPVVRTRLVCGPLDREIDVTVTDRTGMIFRMILGRHALAGHAMVDPALTYTTRDTAARDRTLERRARRRSRSST